MALVRKQRIPADRDPTSFTRILVLRRKPGWPVTANKKRLRLPRLRSIKSVYVACLHEVPRTAAGIKEAIAFIESFDETVPRPPFVRYEVGVRYTNGDEVRGQFNDKAAAIVFLRGTR